VPQPTTQQTTWQTTWPTPHAVVDRDVLTANVLTMQAWCDERGISLRPHAKTHKTLEIARLQLDAGAVGITVATVGEAEVYADLLAAADRDVLVAYPVAVPAERLTALARRVRVVVGVDSRPGVERAAEAGVAVCVEVDSGLARSGVAPADAGELAAHAEERGVEVTGVFTFPGHGYTTGDGAARAAADEARALLAASASLGQHGVASPVRSGGCTPTAAHADAGAVTELRPGVYALHDAGQVALGVARLDQVAMRLRATVVSTAVPGQVVLDAGAKVLGMDRPAFVEGHGLLPAYPHARIDRIWEHHGVVDLRGGPGPRLGDVVDVVPNHVCATINLLDELVVGEERWTVAARGRNS
jgi:D-serine deaminase-like pyridoxal phosphate-dependent protein